MKLDPRVPTGPLRDKWDNAQAEMKLVSPGLRGKRTVIVVGSGLAGASCAASLGELGYRVTCLSHHGSPRRAHSVAAQGGINASKNYQNDGDSVLRFFKDTIKGGDFRSREASVYRMCQLSAAVIDQCLAQGVPFAREYGGMLSNRSFGGVQVSRTFYSRGQTGQQLLLGAYSALSRESGRGAVSVHPYQEVLDLVLVDGRVRGVIARDLKTGALLRHAADAVVLATGGYGKIFYLATLAMNCNATALWRAHRRGACMANPSWTQIHPTSIPPSSDSSSKLTLMSESLRNDGRIWAPKKSGDARRARDIPEEERDYYLERMYPSFGNLAPRDISSRAARRVCDEGRGVGPGGRGVYMDFKDAIAHHGQQEIQARYSNLFAMYKSITGINALQEPMVIYPAAHFSMGGLWVDYHLMTTLPGLFAGGECNFADHGANRLGANSLLQACVDGYYVLPRTVSHYLAETRGDVSAQSHEFAQAEEEVRQRIARIMSLSGAEPVDSFHKELGQILWQECAMVRNGDGLSSAIQKIRELRGRFYQEARMVGTDQGINLELEKALRIADYLELGELMCRDALRRQESCGAHFRTEFQTEAGEAARDDKNCSHSSAWQLRPGSELEWDHHAEPLNFENITPDQRSYK